MKPECVEIEGSSTEQPLSHQMSGGQGRTGGEGQPEQRVASALTHGLSDLAQKPEALMMVLEGERQHEASMQGANEVLVSFPHLFLSPLHPPICSQINRQWVTKCCPNYLMLLITVTAQCQLAPQKQNIFM